LRQEPAVRDEAAEPSVRRQTYSESGAVRAKTKQKQKGAVMHIASGLALVKRDPAQSDIGTAHTRRMARVRWSPEQADALRARLRKMLPGAILLTALVLLGALFPILF
jgi:ATP-dependent exoDNAse (exonuclease V) beta subunit